MKHNFHFFPEDKNLGFFYISVKGCVSGLRSCNVLINLVSKIAVLF